MGTILIQDKSGGRHRVGVPSDEREKGQALVVGNNLVHADVNGFGSSKLSLHDQAIIQIQERFPSFFYPWGCLVLYNSFKLS